MTDGDTRRRRPVVALAVVVAVSIAAAVAVLVTRGRDDGPLERARSELADDAAFTRSSDAGAAFTRASDHLGNAARSCDGGPRSCPELATAAAFARVGAVALLRCGRPEVFRFRAEFRAYLDALDSDPDATPPVAPAC